LEPPPIGIAANLITQKFCKGNNNNNNINNAFLTGQTPLPNNHRNIVAPQKFA
jgi:hypothetical protein